MPIGFVFFIARRACLADITSLPSKLTLPTLTLGPSSMLKTTSTDDGGICRTSGVTSAYWRPRSPSSSLSTNAAALTFVGS